VGAALEGSAAAPGAAVTGELSEDTTRLITMPAYSLVSAGYLRTHGLPVLHGRDFEPGDAAGDGVAILSTTAAARLYPRESAVGHMVKLGGPASKAPWVRIVGVARTPVLLSIEAELAPVLVWVCRRLEGWPTAFVLVRSGARDPKVALRVRQAVRGVPDVRAAYVSSFTDERDRELASRSFLAKVFVGMGVVGLALAALGLYGVLAYAVTERTREFAVRVALGAERRTIFRMVMHDGLVMLLAGTGVGAFGALASAYLLNAVLVAVYPTDVISLIIAEAVLIGVGLAAALVPARRAMRADPIEILRAT